MEGAVINKNLMNMSGIRIFSGHHIRENLYFPFVTDAELPAMLDGKVSVEYPILLSDDPTDDYCRNLCRFKHPTINFCRGPKARSQNKNDAEILGMEFGREYSDVELEKIFTEKARIQGITIGNHYTREVLMEKFYQSQTL